MPPTPPPVLTVWPFLNRQDFSVRNLNRRPEQAAIVSVVLSLLLWGCVIITGLTRWLFCSVCCVCSAIVFLF